MEENHPHADEFGEEKKGNYKLILHLREGGKEGSGQNLNRGNSY